MLVLKGKLSILFSFQASCHDVNNCHPNAQCMYDSYTQSYSCQCNAGYDGDGIYCNKLGKGEVFILKMCETFILLI